MPGRFAYENVLTHHVILKIIPLPKKVDLRLKIVRYDACNASARVRAVLGFKIIFHDCSNFCTNCVQSCIVFFAECCLNQIRSIFRLEQSIYIGVTRFFNLVLYWSFKTCGCPFNGTFVLLLLLPTLFRYIVSNH